MRVTVARGILLALLVSSPAFSEVMDKEPELTEVWAAGFIISAIVLVGGRIHPLLGFLLLPLQMFSPALVALSEVYDKFVGPAIASEAGLPYVFGAHAANALVIGSLAFGIFLWQKSRTKAGAALVVSREGEKGGWKVLRR